MQTGSAHAFDMLSVWGLSYSASSRPYRIRLAVAALFSMQRCRRYGNLKPIGRSNLMLCVLLKRETTTSQTVRICASKIPEHTTGTRHCWCCRDRSAPRQSDQRKAISFRATIHSLAYQHNSSHALTVYYTTNNSRVEDAPIWLVRRHFCVDSDIVR
jgi:hypothetical protein